MLHDVLAYTMYVFLCVNQVLYHILLMLRHISASTRGWGNIPDQLFLQKWMFSSPEELQVIGFLNSAITCVFGTSTINSGCDCENDPALLWVNQRELQKRIEDNEVLWVFLSNLRRLFCVAGIQSDNELIRFWESYDSRSIYWWDWSWYLTWTMYSSIDSFAGIFLEIL